MPGTLSKADLLTDHKTALGDAATKFGADSDVNYERHLNHALLAFSRIRRRTLLADITLESGECNYPAPSNCIAPKVSDWGRNKIKPWQKGYAPLPRMHTYALDDASLMISLSPPPTAFQIGAFGSKYSFFYLAIHVIDDDAAKTTFSPADRDLFLLLAMIEALKELAMLNVTDPIQLHRGMGSMPANATPTALIELFNRQVELMK